MTDTDFPGLAHIRQTPSLLRTLLTGITATEAAWKPAPGRWSINEVLAHLHHVEEHVFRARLPKMLSEDNPLLDGYDPQPHAASGAYAGHTVADSLSEFQRLRDANVSLLSAAPPEALAHTARHADLGPITLEQHLNEWAIHDLGHLRQITELIRAVRYHPNLGPWQPHYPVNP